MHELTPVTALNAAAPVREAIGDFTLAENDTPALASVAARLGREDEVRSGMAQILGTCPGPNESTIKAPLEAFWTAPDQWMVSAPTQTHEGLADMLRQHFTDAASVTEQSGGWVCFDVTGQAVAGLCERLCPVPIRIMAAGETRRTRIHHLGCFLQLRSPGKAIRLFGPRASAQTLFEALKTAARAVSGIRDQRPIHQINPCE